MLKELLLISKALCFDLFVVKISLEFGWVEADIWRMFSNADHFFASASISMLLKFEVWAKELTGHPKPLPHPKEQTNRETDKNIEEL